MDSLNSFTTAPRVCLNLTSLLCWLGWHCGQLHFGAGQGLVPVFDELMKHGKLCRYANSHILPLAVEQLGRRV